MRPILGEQEKRFEVEIGFDPSQSDASAARRAWLASLLLRPGGAPERLVHAYRQLRQLPRPFRRRLHRRLALTLGAAALMLALSQSPAHAANITVINGEVNIAGNGKCSLREAIINANLGNQTHTDCAAGAAGADTINLPSNGTFLVKDGTGIVYGSQTGLPTITGAITINGNNSTIRRDATTKFRLLAVASTGNLTLNQTTLSDGHSTDDGGAIYNYGGIVTLNNCVVSGNTADGSGGGLHNYPSSGPTGTINVNQSVFRLNEAAGPGGAINMLDSDYSGGTLNLVNSTLEGNSSNEGGAIHAHYSSLVITGSTISGNTSNTYGGGIFMWGSSAGIVGSTLNDNTAVNSGGGIATLGFFTLDVTNSTLSGNAAGDWGGGIDGDGGDYGGSVEITNSTITENTANGGGGLTGFYTDTILRRNLIAGNTANSAGPEVYIDGSSGATISANSHNIFGHDGNSGVIGFSPGATDIVPAAKLVAIRNPELADNGGPTRTHALVKGSPALDAAPSASCNAAPVNGVDQRGLGRNSNGAGGGSSNECDIGAFESQGVPPDPQKFLVSPTTAGNVQGLAARPEDILQFDPVTETWTFYFDGGDVGADKPLSAFSRMTDGTLLLAFKVNTTLPGVGAITPWDVVRFTPTMLGSTTTGAFSWYIDGGDVGLATAAEKIDALDSLPDGRIVLSTTGTAAVPGAGKAQDEDILAFTPTATGPNTSGTWALYFNGTAVQGMGAEDLTGAAVSSASGYLYLSLLDNFNLDGVSGNAGDILVFEPGVNGFDISRAWRGSNNGFGSLKLGGIERY